MIYQCKRSRRLFLIDASGAFLALPFLTSLSGLSEAEAVTDSAVTANKFISIYLRNGFHGSYFYPQIARSKMSPITATTLESNLPDVISPILGSSFTPLKNDILIYRGLDYLCSPEVTHNVNQFLLSRPVPADGIFSMETARPSIDYYIANQVYGQNTPFSRILNTSIEWRTVPINYSYSNVSGNKFSFNSTGFRDVETIWTSIFGGHEVSENEKQREKNLDSSVVDKVLNSYNNLRKDARLSGSDQLLVDQHITHLAELEKNIKNAPRNLCSGPEKLTIPYGEGLPIPYRAATRAMIDIMVAMISCGLTKVVNFNLNPDTIFAGLAPFNYEHHAISHGTNLDSAQKLSAILAELFDHIAYFITRLKETNSMTGLVGMIGNEIGNQAGGSDGTPESPSIDHNHAGLDAMCMLFGDPAILNTGKYVHAERGIRGGRWHNGYYAGWNEGLVSIMDLFGVPPSAYEIPGQAGYGFYSNSANFGLTKADVVSPSTIRGKALDGIRRRSI